MIVRRKRDDEAVRDGGGGVDGHEQWNYPLLARWMLESSRCGNFSSSSVAWGKVNIPVGKVELITRPPPQTTPQRTKRIARNLLVLSPR